MSQQALKRNACGCPDLECESDAVRKKFHARSLRPDDNLTFLLDAFTEAAQLAYALSSLFRQRGAVTVLGGPHARCYPEDAQRYFDYVLGFTDRQVLDEVEALRRAVGQMVKGEVIVVFYEKLQPIQRALQELDAQPVMALPPLPVVARPKRVRTVFAGSRLGLPASA